MYADAGLDVVDETGEEIVDFALTESAPESETRVDTSRANRGKDSKSVDSMRFQVTTDPSRDALLTDFGKETLKDRYLLPGESYQDLFARVASAYADDGEHAQRVYDYISRSGSCPRRPCCPTAAPAAACPSPAI
jgi:ribonucleoside-diphosphate reductase alpha chain